MVSALNNSEVPVGQIDKTLAASNINRYSNNNIILITFAHKSLISFFLSVRIYNRTTFHLVDSDLMQEEERRVRNIMDVDRNKK